MQTVLVFGNRALKEDNAALELLSFLQESIPEIEFRECDPNELPVLEELNVLDVANVRAPRLLTNVDKIQPTKTLSLHGFDLALTLKLLKKTGRIKRVNVFCIPQKMTSKDKEDLVDLIRATLL